MNSCLISLGTICDECRSVCPSELRAIKIFDRQVHIDLDKCSACGLCSFYCDNAGAAIKIENI
jgi:ferredoxin